MEMLDTDMLRSLHESRKRLEVNIRIPKIDVALKSDLIPALVSMGIERVFDYGAQLSAMLPKAPQTVCIDQVNQGCTFMIDEDGVVAQAITIAGDMDIALPVMPGGDFFLDHPFVFAIRENSSGAILFMGKIGKL